MTDAKPTVHEALAVYAPETDDTDRVPPGYKRTEVGVIPEDWEVHRVGEICDFIVPGRNKPREFNGDIPWITTTDLEGKLSVAQSKLGLFVSEDEARRIGSQIVPSGSVIMTCVGDLGIVAIVSRDLVMNQQLHAFIPSEVIDATYLSNALKNQRPYMESLSTKTAVPYLNKDNCNSVPIALPPLHEQRAIAAALSDVDGLISALDKLTAKKRAVKTAAMQQLLTGKQRLPGFSGEWEVKRLGELGHFAKGKGIRRNELVSDGLPCVRYGEIYTLHHDYIRAFHSFIPRSVAQMSQLIRRGDLLFTGSGETVEEIGKCVAYLGDQEAYAGGDIVILSPESGNSMFLGYLMNHSSVVTQKSSLGQGDAVVHISARNLASLEFDLPSIEEQTAIAAVLSDMDAEIEALEGRREKTRRIKAGMMQELLTGRTRLV